ncbi:IstB-like ATP binding protein [Thermoleophilum album]|uniref:IstB-like ATP binding protein n=1 Tax=Thermoleophilum album TaxID=29539 RepID=A0A1H6FN07_THEAL|nr:IstB-like ATP binding protein [Thermoleophilum album]
MRGAGHLKPVDKPERDCPLGRCDGSGWLLAEDGRSATPCGCRERRIARSAGRFLGTTIPRRFRGLSFERRPISDLDPTIVDHVREFCERIDENLDAGRGLWFHGDVGTGKTSLAMLVAMHAERADRSVAIYSVPQLLARIRQTFEGAGTSYLELFRRLCEVDLLVLDDLGAERQTEWVLEQLYSLVNERWQDRRSIVVTTNSPDRPPSAPLEELRAQAARLRAALDDPMMPERAFEVLERLERICDRLEALDAGEDMLARLRAQIGRRTISRLVEICGDPLPMHGPDRRIRFEVPGDEPPEQAAAQHASEEHAAGHPRPV